jgi:hypothetical protein
MKKSLVAPAIGAAVLHAFSPSSAQASPDWDRYASSGYEYCDAVILGAHWGESVNQAKVTIGRKIGFGNAHIVASDLDTAVGYGQRCAFEDTGFSYEDAVALAQLWGIGVEDAKAQLAEKVSTGYRGLAEDVVAQAHSQGVTDDDWNNYANSGYAYCDAVMLGAHWGEGIEEAKLRIGRKIGWGDHHVVENDLQTARHQGQRCAFLDTGFGFNDAAALARMWGISVDEAKVALAEKVSMGWRQLADEVVTEAHQG